MNKYLFVFLFGILIFLTLNQKYIIVTNECRNEPRQIRQELKTMNINIPEYVPIVSASQLVKKTLLKSIIGNNSNYTNKKNKGSFNQKIGIIGTNNEYLYYKKSFKNYNNVKKPYRKRVL